MGLPLEVQTDHEVVYTGSPSADFPSLFTLWLVGLGLRHVVSRNHRPTDQAHAERNHRTLGDMAWKDEHFAVLLDLQAALDKHRRRHNGEFPTQAAACQGQPPLIVFPWATHSGRPYQLDREWELFDLHRVDDFLASRVWRRQISRSGNVAIGNHLYPVSRLHAGQTVSVCFIPGERLWRFQLADGAFLRQQPVRGLDKADLIGFMPLEVAAIPFQLPLPLVGV